MTAPSETLASDAPDVSAGSRRFVLVHGAFHAAWSWEPVAAELRARGHRVDVFDLPGAGEDPTPLSEVTLDLAAGKVVEVIESSPEPAVLVGHSMGGIVITEAAGRVPSRISRLVYVTAFRPVDGESLLDLAGLPEGAADGVQANITIEGEPPNAVFDRAKADEVFYHDLPEEVRAAARDRLDPQPLSIFATPVRLPEPIAIPTDYVICTEDGAIPPKLQTLMADRAPATVFRLASSHSPMFSFTRELSDILAR